MRASSHALVSAPSSSVSVGGMIIGMVVRVLRCFLVAMVEEWQRVSFLSHFYAKWVPINITLNTS